VAIFAIKRHGKNYCVRPNDHVRACVGTDIYIVVKIEEIYLSSSINLIVVEVSYIKTKEI
jgi:hypothetical protein